MKKINRVKKERKLLFLWLKIQAIVLIDGVSTNVESNEWVMFDCIFVTKNNKQAYFIYAVKLIYNACLFRLINQIS